MIIFVNWISTHLLWSPEALQEGFQKQGSIFLFVFFEKAMDIEIVIMSHTWREVYSRDSFHFRCPRDQFYLKWPVRYLIRHIFFQEENHPWDTRFHSSRSCLAWFHHKQRFSILSNVRRHTSFRFRFQGAKTDFRGSYSASTKIRFTYCRSMRYVFSSE